jgi:hypothetical protein
MQVEFADGEYPASFGTEGGNAMESHVIVLIAGLARV